MCAPHWADVSKAIREADLFRFVSNSGAQAVEKLRSQLIPGESAVAGYDPLANATVAIYSNALTAGGMYLLGVKEDGSDYCPLCELEAHSPVKAETWIGCAVDEQLALARKYGLVPEESVQ